MKENSIHLKERNKQMEKYWWIISVIKHSVIGGSSPDDDSFLIGIKEIFRFFGSFNEETKEYFKNKISNFSANKIDFVWCLNSDGEKKEESEELKKYLKETLNIH